MASDMTKLKDDMFYGPQDGIQLCDGDSNSMNYTCHFWETEWVLYVYMF